MGQREILEFFKKLEAIGMDEYVSLKQINKHTSCNFKNTERAINKLTKSGLLDIDKSKWQKRFKLKKKVG